MNSKGFTAREFGVDPRNEPAYHRLGNMRRDTYIFSPIL
jgi:hypothetical protein